jgi:hypothetical protein
VLLIALAFMGGTIGVAFAFGAEPCSPSLHAATPGHEGHHHQHDTNTLTCISCLCCAVIPTLTGAPVAIMAPRQVAYVVYRQELSVMAGRSVAPDPTPPRSIA